MTDLADFTSHRIEGYTNEGGHHFSVPLFSQIAENLWMGGCPKAEGAPQFDTIICLYPWEPYKVHPGQVLVSVQMMDSHDVPDPLLLDQLTVAALVGMERGTVLVHCQAGLNRSGLLTALLLLCGGMNPAEAIAHIRARRCDAALCNKAFEKFLLDLDQREVPDHVDPATADSVGA